MAFIQLASLPIHTSTFFFICVSCVSAFYLTLTHLNNLGLVCRLEHTGTGPPMFQLVGELLYRLSHSHLICPVARTLNKYIRPAFIQLRNVAKITNITLRMMLKI